MRGYPRGRAPLSWEAYAVTPWPIVLRPVGLGVWGFAHLRWALPPLASNKTPIKVYFREARFLQNSTPEVVMSTPVAVVLILSFILVPIVAMGWELYRSGSAPS